MQTLSFRTKLLLGFSCLLLPALLAPYWLYGRVVGNDLFQETRSRALQLLDVVTWLTENHEPFQDMEAFDDWITQLGAKMGIRITYVSQGQVLADSEVAFEDVPAMDDHGSRPEVARASQEGLGIETRYSHTLGKELLYAAKPMEAVAGLPQGILRLSIPMSEVRAHLHNLWWELSWIVIITLGATMLVSLIISRTMSRSIRGLAETALAIGRGDFGKRIRVYPGAEFQPLVDSINTMAGHIQSAMAVLEDQKGQLQAVFQGMSEGVMVVDGRGRIESFNMAMERMVPEVCNCVGRTPLEATMDTELHKALESLLTRPGMPDAVVVPLSTGRGRFIEVLLEPFRDPHGARKVLLVFRDVSDLKRLETIRRDFVANVSHELRTPVTSIKGYAETLLDAENPDPAQQRKFLEIILRNADHMAVMVQKLLRLAQVEHHGAGKVAAEVDAAGALSRALNTVAPLADEAGAVLVNEIEGPNLVLAEETGLEEVFRNLLENAVKFGPKGGKVTITSRREDDWTVFTVRDHGPGVPLREHERIFERFYRSRENTGGKESGTGLGLAICRHLVESFGGTIHAETPADRNLDDDLPGAAFTFRLKTAPPDDAAQDDADQETTDKEDSAQA